jgi:hypothetical protein
MGINKNWSWDRPYIAISGNAEEQSGRQGRIRVVANWEAISQSQKYSYTVTRPDPEAFAHALWAIRDFPPVMENPQHKKEVAKFIARARNVVKTGASIARGAGEIASILGLL